MDGNLLLESGLGGKQLDILPCLKAEDSYGI